MVKLFGERICQHANGQNSWDVSFGSMSKADFRMILIKMFLICNVFIGITSIVNILILYFYEETYNAFVDNTSIKSFYEESIGVGCV